MVIISITNQKGGCGKTTTAVNLSAYLTLRGKSTLLIDLDPQGAATTGLGVDKWGVEMTVYDALVRDVDIEDVIVPTQMAGLDLVSANIDLSGALLELVGQIAREYILKEKLASIDRYTYIIIDTPPSLDLLTLNALVASSEIIIPIQTEYYALEGMSQLLKVVNMVGERLSNRVKKRILLTMYDGRTNLSKEVVGQVRDRFKDEVFQTIIPRNVTLAEAPSYGKPVCLYEPESAGAKAYEQLAEEMISS